MTEKTSPIALEDRAEHGVRMSSPSAARNREPITLALKDRLPEGARVLEIASGTGEHALAVVGARPDLSWTPSDPDPRSRASQNAWAEDAEGRIRPSLDLDVCAKGWWENLEAVDALYCANMIHIAPWEAAEGLFEGASQLLAPKGGLYLYGPFLEGAETAASNLDFDASLKQRDPSWGVRSIEAVDALAARCGFARTERLVMPSNNLMLTFHRSAA
ncbi:DUF938 domain-containing protein [Oceanicaulis sp. LC35]|uniref:DUF938 domain-containing protein n=1 Tax=Oceanicaulis sp. LC35 TaxID=3349635 RepID=UPI003F82632B